VTTSIPASIASLCAAAVAAARTAAGADAPTRATYEAARGPILQGRVTTRGQVRGA